MHVIVQSLISSHSPTKSFVFCFFYPLPSFHFFTVLFFFSVTLFIFSLLPSFFPITFFTSLFFSSFPITLLTSSLFLFFPSSLLCFASQTSPSSSLFFSTSLFPYPFDSVFSLTFILIGYKDKVFRSTQHWNTHRWWSFLFCRYHIRKLLPLAQWSYPHEDYTMSGKCKGSMQQDILAPAFCTGTWLGLFICLVFSETGIAVCLCVRFLTPVLILLLMRKLGIRFRIYLMGRDTVS